MHPNFILGVVYCTCQLLSIRRDPMGKYLGSLLRILDNQAPMLRRWNCIIYQSSNSCKIPQGFLYELSLQLQIISLIC